MIENRYFNSIRGKVISVSLKEKLTFSREHHHSITLVEAIGVKVDAHVRSKVKYRSRAAMSTQRPKLRQAHYVHSEFSEELKDSCDMKAGQLGEHITTYGIPLLELPTDTILYIGDKARIQITGLRNPYVQLDKCRLGLMKALLDRDKDGNLIRKAGVMGVVLKSGEVRPSDSICIQLPPLPFKKLECV